MKRCTQRADVAAEHELRELEGFSRPAPLPDWDACVNCGEQYGPTAIAAHTKRCKRLRPHGANGFGPGGDGGTTSEGAAPFKGLFGVGDGEAAAKPPPPSEADLDLDALRALFDKFDSNKDGVLDEDEFGKLLCQMMPTRVGDFIHAEDETDEKFNVNLKFADGDIKLKLSLQFKAADTDGSGTIDFDEFVTYWKQARQGSKRPHIPLASCPLSPWEASCAHAHAHVHAHAHASLMS